MLYLLFLGIIAYSIGYCKKKMHPGAMNHQLYEGSPPKLPPSFGMNIALRIPASPLCTHQQSPVNPITK
jgi:hypothetical protein